MEREPGLIYINPGESPKRRQTYVRPFLLPLGGVHLLGGVEDRGPAHGRQAVVILTHHQLSLTGPLLLHLKPWLRIRV